MLNVQNAVEILRAGGLVAMPTETVYGLAADARNPAALRKIFLAKQRPIDHPLIIHIGALEQLSEWADDISDRALALARAFWPGPLTLILKKAPGVSDLVTGGQTTIGIRIPNHPVALALLREFGGGVAAPSANRFGRISPTSAQAVFEELGSSVDLILEGGVCGVGLESTIVDLTADYPVILRPGMISAQQIATVLNREVHSQPTRQTIRVSGALESHYAPITQTRLMTSAALDTFVKTAQHSSAPTVLLLRQPRSYANAALESVVMPSTPTAYAHDLYATLREWDKRQVQEIIIEDVPKTADWDAIRDRITRATGSR